MARYYIWFIVVVAGLAGAIRLALPARFAELQLVSLKKSTPARMRWRALLFLAGGLIFGSLYYSPWGHQSWIVIGTVFSLLSAAEAFFQAQFPTMEALVFQSRLLGILYLGLAAAAYVMLGRV